jgi:hypothetical protein
MRAILIQGDSVRMTWGIEEATPRQRKPRPRERAQPAAPPESGTDILRIRLGEELDYARRRLDALGDELSADPILIRRHHVSLQSLDIVGQILGHIGDVIRSGDPQAAIESIGMGDLKGRLMRSGVL